MTRRPVAASVDALVAGASSRTPVEFDDAKSGARFERVVLRGERLLLKHVDVRDDWIMRQTGDIGCIPIRLWEEGIYDLVPECIEHTTVGAAREGTHGAVLLRDVGAWLVPTGDDAIDPEQHVRFLEHLAALHAAMWRWEDTVGLLPLANRYSFFGPDALRCEASLGYPQPVARIASEGWTRLDDASPELAIALRPLRRAPWPLLDALADTPSTFLHGDTKTANLGVHPDGRTIMIDWSQSGAGPPLAEIAHSLALNRARIPPALAGDATVATYRAALERHGIDTAPWFERQLSLCLVGVMLQLAWEKALDPTGDDLAWWCERTVDAARELSRA